MSMTAALNNFMRWRGQQDSVAASARHERLESQDDDETIDVEIGINNNRNNPREESTQEEEERRRLSINEDDEDEEAIDAMESQPTTATSSSSRANINNTAEADEDTGIVANEAETTTANSTSRLATLRELEEERDLARRRTSACMLLAIFVLFRLWIEALMQGDIGLLLLCMVGTSWTARFIRFSREREEELDRQILNVQQGNTDDDDDENRDVRFMSFQAQLALAIMESQRQMLQGGGFGHPDGQQGSAGVTDSARQEWEHFSYSADNHAIVSTDDDEEPHCTICLGEYEEGDELVKLPCKHVYHKECIDGWTTNHVRCPLCNFDLESVTTTTSNTTSE